MKYAVMSVLAATLLLGACESSTQQSGAGDGSGQAYQGGGAGGGGRTGVNQSGIGGPYADGPGTLDGTIPDRVFFATDQYSLSPEARAILDQQAGYLARYNQAFITLAGHADERGTREYNLALGERRAASVRNYLVARGVAANRIRTISYGKEKPAVTGFGEEAWAKNRRTVTALQ